MITGGGTGGHIYPALEVGRAAQIRGANLSYLGSIRGQESASAAAVSVPFIGFASEPLWSLRTPKGWRALAKLLRATITAKAYLRQKRPDAVFSTGGYGAAPVVFAARSLGVPYFVHEANSVPGRVNRMTAKGAKAFTSVFRATEKHVPGVKVIRTGQPIRAELRFAAKSRVPDANLLLVLGGSQGSEFLNQIVPAAVRIFAPKTPDVIHATGRSHIDLVQSRLLENSLTANYQAVPYLETADLARAYLLATIAIARSGGTLAEFALFRIPSVLIPLPTSADQHQLFNAREFEEMGAAVVLNQVETTPSDLKNAIESWLTSPERRAVAESALAAWDIPDATDRIVGIIEASIQS